MVEKFIVSRDDSIYEAFPDVALTASGRLVCVFAECTHHADRGYTRVAIATSEDRGRTWTPKRPLSRPLSAEAGHDHYWNCPRITALRDGTLVALCDRNRREKGPGGVWAWTSEDEGDTWEGPEPLPVEGIVPDRLVELRHGLHPGRWLASAHTRQQRDGETLWAVRCWYSDDRGTTWTGPVTIAAEPGLQLCEGSVMELPDGELACFMRENSGRGLDAFKAVSLEGGETWEPVCRFPLPACHRPVAGMLRGGGVLITHRFMQGGKGWVGWWTQNLFAALTDVESCLAFSREDAHTRILPLDFDRSPESDTGYSGWVQFPDGEIYVVNYIVDDAPEAHIRGYSLREADFVL